jgi:hypothetical protein
MGMTGDNNGGEEIFIRDFGGEICRKESTWKI